MKPLLVSLNVRFIALVIAARVSFIVLAVDQLLAGAAIRLQPIFPRRGAVKLARVFNDFATTALLDQAGLRNVAGFCHYQKRLSVRVCERGDYTLKMSLLHRAVKLFGARKCQAGGSGKVAPYT